MTRTDSFDLLRAQLHGISSARAVGTIRKLGRGGVHVAGLSAHAALGDRVEFEQGQRGEVLAIGDDGVLTMVEGPSDGLRLGERVVHQGPPRLAPDHSWLGRVIDPDGRPLDGRSLMNGAEKYGLYTAPPSPTARRGLGQRLSTGYAVFDTLLPIVRGQRLGLFAGSGVGKSSLIAELARNVSTDVIVIGLIGERGREVRDFIFDTLGPEALRRCIVIAATSDRPALTRARAAATMMTTAEYFRDRGANVLVLADSITRFAEAHRDVAAVAGEAFGPTGFPASMAQNIMSLAERAGPGEGSQGDITAIFSVLVPGSDMDGPVADVLRGVLDGHVVLSRDIAERGRFPAIDLLRSVSRSLPAAASPEENAAITRTRALLGAYDRAEMMLQAGLYTPGADALVDGAVKVWSDLDAFIGRKSDAGIAGHFDALARILARASGPS